MALAPGTRLGPYEIAAHLGAGGMGEVYRARDTRLDRTVALKISKEQFTPRFETEARATAALEHPHICRLYDICHDEGTSFLVMEYVEGTPLAGPLPLDRVLTYAGQIASALDEAHRKQIVHRDLKPSNVLVTPKGGVKLLDFGLAKLGSGTGALDDEALTRGLTAAGTIVGTLHYMSPEQLQGNAADTRSDIFAFGVVLYEMLTGKRAFEGASPASVIAAILERPAPSIATVAPSSLDRLLQRCLAKDPDERWQSARDVKAALDLIVEPTIAAPAPIVRAPRRAPWPWLTAATLAAALGGLALVHFRERPPRS
jgi:serine/threonine protein kinase